MKTKDEEEKEGFYEFCEYFSFDRNERTLSSCNVEKETSVVGDSHCY